MNIYVPADLLLKMRPYGRTEQSVRAINWSQVACDAFIAAMKQHDDYMHRTRYGMRARRQRLWDSHVDKEM